MKDRRRGVIHVVCFRHGGTHLVVRLVRKLCSYHAVNDVLKNTSRQYLIYSERRWGSVVEFQPPAGKKIICWRDPRDLIVSKIRHTRKTKRPNRPIEKDTAVREFLHQDRVVYPDDIGGGHIEQMLRVARRWENVGALRIPFEVIADDATGPDAADKIAMYLGVDGGAECFREIYGIGKTFNETKTDWREWFGKKALAMFEAKGGRELVERLGYQWEVPHKLRGHEMYCAADDMT